MNLETDDLYPGQDLEAANNAEGVNDVENDIHASLSPSTAAVLAYGAYKVLDIPVVKEKIEDIKDAATDYVKEIGDDIKDFTMGVYDSVKEFFTGTKEAEVRESAMYSKEFSETREFGIDRCVEAAEGIFSPNVIANWANLSYDDRAALCYAYSDEVAKAFELENYQGVVFEELEPGTLGYNCGDGYIHLTTELLNPLNTPFNLIDTITHELRHQYQSECVNGAHDVADEVRNEWAVASEIYTTDSAWCYDPWGYMYNPLEIDSRYAGETVVREISNHIFNNAIA